jgi:hypothetical protein
MAVEVMNESSGNVLAIRASDKMTDDDYKDTWIPKMEELLKAHGALRVLIYMDESFEGFAPGAIWDDTKFGFSHLGTAARGKFEKIAMVGGSDWYRRLGEIFGHLMPGELKSFEASDLDDALEWVKS